MVKAMRTEEGFSMQAELRWLLTHSGGEGFIAMIFAEWSESRELYNGLARK